MHVHCSFPKEAQCRDGQISDVAITNCVRVCHLGHKHFFRVDTKDWKRIGIEKTANHDCDISCVIPGTKGPAGNSVTHAPQNLGWYRPLMLLTLLPPEKVADRFSLTHHGCLQERWHNHDYFDVGLWCSGNWTGICFNGNIFDYIYVIWAFSWVPWFIPGNAAILTLSIWALLNVLIKSFRPSDAYVCQQSKPSSVWITSSC